MSLKALSALSVKVDCPKVKKRWTSTKKKKKNVHATKEDLVNDNNSDSSDIKTANICLMADKERCKEKLRYTSFESNSDFGSEAKYISYDPLLQNLHTIALEYKTCKEKLRYGLLENEKLK